MLNRIGLRERPGNESPTGVSQSNCVCIIMCGHASYSIGTHSITEMVLGRWLQVQRGTISLLKAQYAAFRTDCQ